MNQKTIGVLGGMGPFATAQFFQTLLQLTPAKKDWEHHRIVIDNNPHIPSRSRHLLYGETSPHAGMLESCLKLQAFPVDLIAIPCNSASIFIPELRSALRIPVVHIAEVTVAALVANHSRIKRVAVLGGRVVYQTPLYPSLLAPHGVEVVAHSIECQGEVESIIEAIKLNTDLPGCHARLERCLVHLMRDEGAEGFILACTEFHLLPPFTLSAPVLDSSLQLAREVLRLAGT